ncbi:MAG: capsular biosynthesis protein [Bacteroidales bacterium]|nr:capsular biosynthesis protein [Bacteroidales bacterium]
MWPFSSKSALEACGLFKGFTDWHSHILPGVDDGIPTQEEAFQVLERFEQLGFSTLWLTPHVMEDIPNTTENLRQKFQDFTSAYNGTIKLHLAAEYMLDNGFEERLHNNDLLCIGVLNTKTLLVETSYFSPPMDLYGTLKRIRDKGYQPLLAHPERYLYMGSNDYERLKAMDVHFQCNVSSLTGAYGKEASHKFFTFLAKGWIQALGTDTHMLNTFNQAIARKCINGKQGTLLAGIPNVL